MSAAITRRTFSRGALAFAAATMAASDFSRIANAAAGSTPVILATDIGDDIDDTWALLMLLRMPELDLKLAVSDFGNAVYRCRLLAKLLEVTGRTDVPVGIGLEPKDEPGRQSGWLGDYQLDEYPGMVHEDGVQAMIDIILDSPQPVTLLGIGPVPTIAEALRREPRIADNARFVGMQGSVFIGYNGAAEPAAEWNVRVDPQSLQEVFAAPWDCTITPLDTCGLVHLQGDNFKQLYESNDPGLVALMENYKTWLPHAPYIDPDTDPSSISTTLFDAVAVYLAAEQDLVEMQDIPLRVTDDGYTVVDEVDGRIVHCAIAWKDLAAFEKKLVKILAAS